MSLAHQWRGALALGALLALILATSVSAAAGDLDPSFDGDGKVVTDMSGAEDRAFAVAVQRDGKIVVGGQAADGSSSTFALARYNADGSLDGGFGSGGKVRTAAVGVSLYFIGGVAIQSDGKIVAAGSAGSTGRFFDFAVARYNPDGTIDTTFGTGGATTTDFLTSSDHPQAVAIQPDGRIVVAGVIARPGPLRRHFALARYDASGQLDPTFDGDGKLVTEFSPVSDDELHDVVLQPDGRIVVAGEATGSGQDFALARYNADGSLDATFDGDGRVLTRIEANWGESAWGLALQPDGKIVAAGDSRNYVFALARYNANGSLDQSFHDDGVLTTEWETQAPARDVLVQPDGKIVAVGGVGLDFALARYNRNGSLDTTFGSRGKLATDLGSEDYAWSVALQSDGRIVVAGESGRGATSNFAVARYVGVTPTCRVPNVRGRTLARARAALRTARCSLGRVQRRRSATVPRGLVISQSPKPRTTLAEGARVSVVVSLGRRR